MIQDKCKWIRLNTAKTDDSWWCNMYQSTYHAMTEKNSQKGFNFTNTGAQI